MGESFWKYFWLILGFTGQAAFFGRFLVQWIVSEKNKKSTIPMAFWYFSIAGGTIILIYAIHLGDPVFITGQSCGLFIYLRNLRLISKEKRRKLAEGEGGEAGRESSG